MRPRQNGRHFPDVIFIWIFLKENVRISMKIFLKFVPRGSIYNIPAMVQVMACRLLSTKPLPEQMLAYYGLLGNLNRNSTILIQENSFENGVCQNGIHFVQGEMSYTSMSSNNVYLPNSILIGKS